MARPDALPVPRPFRERTLAVWVLLRTTTEGMTATELREAVDDRLGEPISGEALRRAIDTIDYAAPRLGYRLERLRGQRVSMRGPPPTRFRVRDSIRAARGAAGNSPA